MPAMSSTKKGSLETVLAENLALVMEHKKIKGSKMKTLKGPAERTIFNIIHKKHRPTLKTLEKLSKVLGIDAFQLLCPLPDRNFLSIIEAYNEAAPGERQYLVDNAEVLLRRARRARSEANEGDPR